MLDDLIIKEFVQTALGCNCPEEVFKRIVCEEEYRIDSEHTISHRINIGDRLLIYVSALDPTSDYETWLPRLVDHGEKERDDKDFNRFRLVLVCEKPDRVKDSAYASFGRLGKDKKIHLHIINKNDFPS